MPVPQLPLPFRVRERLDFAAFRPGANGACVEQLQRLAEGRSQANVFLWGVPGCGKSHLLQAVCNRLAGAGGRPAYLPLRERGELAPDILDDLDRLDLVCLDDLQCVVGDPHWETALFHLFNRARDAARPLIMSADAAPAALAVSLPDLKSRLGWDLVFHLQPLDENAIIEVLNHRAGMRGIDLPPEVLEYLARRVPRDPHTLLSWLDRLDSASLAAQKKLTVPFVRKLLEE